MSIREPEAASDEGFEQEVARYLCRHPDFFVRHPELAGSLLVPHSCGEAVSLVEYQARRLRDENRSLRERIETLVRNARQNEELSARVHRLSLSVMGCDRADELFSRLYQSLRDDFDVEFSALRVFAAPAASLDSGLVEFAGEAPSERELFDALLASERPLCGPLGREQARYLFAERSAEVESSALVPLGNSSPFGVLAVASRKSERYRSGMGTLFLRRIAAVVTQALETHLAR